MAFFSPCNRRLRISSEAQQRTSASFCQILQSLVSVGNEAPLLHPCVLYYCSMEKKTLGLSPSVTLLDLSFCFSMSSCLSIDLSSSRALTRVLFPLSSLNWGSTKTFFYGGERCRGKYVSPIDLQIDGGLR